MDKKHIIEYRESNGDLYPSIILLTCEPIAPEIKKLLYDYLTNRGFLEWTTFGVGLVDFFTYSLNKNGKQSASCSMIYDESPLR